MKCARVAIHFVISVKRGYCKMRHIALDARRFWIDCAIVGWLAGMIVGFSTWM